MRPIKLVMTAFGPYRDQETIDFTKLEDRRLFVISGMTGAGKTSIFDAISYALYGSASGEDRADYRMLRSHFADEDTHTSVDFIFAAGSRTYRVFRQMGHRKGTNKNETGGKVELYETTSGEEVPCVDRFTIGDVNAKLESIIGLTKEQFSQIVMLPQGEFRKLLTSDTENKEEILRRIFRTGRYQRLEDRFYEKSKQLREFHKEAAAKLSIHMQNATESLPQREDSALSRTFQQEYYSPAQVIESLADEQAYYDQLTSSARQRRKDASDRVDKLEREHRAAEDLNRLFADLEARRVRRQELEQQKEQMDTLAKLLTTADQAARIEPFEELAASAVKDCEAKRRLYDQTKREVETAGAALDAARNTYELEEKRSDERVKAELDLNRLQELVPAVATLDTRRQEVERLLKEKTELSTKQNDVDRSIASKRQLKAELSEQLKGLETETEQLPEKQRELEHLRQKARLLQELSQLEKQYDEYVRLEEERKKQLEEVRREHDLMESAWIEGQAGMLALHLHDGQPCPVCGSLTHPSKAVSSSELPSRENLMRRKEQLRIAEQELHAATAQAAAARSGKDNKTEDMKEYGIVPEKFAEQLENVVAQGKELGQLTVRLKNRSVQLGQLRNKLKELDEQMEQLIADRERISLQFQETAVQHSKESSLLLNELERIPEALRSPEQLKHSIAEHKQRLDSLTTAWHSARQQFQLAEKRHVELTALAGSMAEQSEEAAAKAKEAENRFKDELVKAGFASIDAYRQARMDEATRESSKERLEQYRQSILVLKEQITELENVLKDRQPIDLTPLKDAILAAKRELDEITAAGQSAERYRQDAERLKLAVEQAYGQLQQVEAELEKVLDIYQVLKGDNPLKISFERYILIEYLEQILHASNIRLQNLSNGQYLLQRSERLESRGRQSGLGLDVFDAYTGQNRDVKTLSGGEKFNASLALALGMTDVIQAHQGGVSIEMMFIDEGFGSLDEESLNKAIATLIDLQKSGRMIGVISHVGELKDAFPAVLEVTKTKEGHSRTALAVK